MNDKELLQDTVNGKPSYEAEELRKTYISCQEKLANKDLDILERKAQEFYLEQLKYIYPCADEHKFYKPGKGIGGLGDTEIIKPYIVRDRKTQKPLVGVDNKLVIIDCIFKDTVRYLSAIQSGRAESLRRIDGVRPLHERDKKYAQTDSYTLIFHKKHGRSF